MLPPATGGKAATLPGCGFEEAACGLSPCHFCHLPFPPHMVEEAQRRDAWKKNICLVKTTFSISLLPLLQSSCHCIILPPNSVTFSSFEGVVGEKNRHRGGGGSKTSCFSCPAANCTTPTHQSHIFPQYFPIFPNISKYCHVLPIASIPIIYYPSTNSTTNNI